MTYVSWMRTEAKWLLRRTEPFDRESVERRNGLMSRFLATRSMAFLMLFMNEMKP